MSKVYTIAQVLATPEAQYVSAQVFATLTRAQPPRGKGPWTAILTDSTGAITGKFWGGDVSYWEGKRIKLSGQGMQRKAYNGVPELSVGQKAEISFAGAPGTAAQVDEGNPDLEAANAEANANAQHAMFAQTTKPVPPQRSYAQTHAQTPLARPVAPTASGTGSNLYMDKNPHDAALAAKPHGATVGGALARAVDIFLHSCPQGHPVDWRIASKNLVERITRDLVEIQQRVESGAPAAPVEHEDASVPF